jgi:hypothetical protein
VSRLTGLKRTGVATLQWVMNLGANGQSRRRVRPGGSLRPDPLAMSEPIVRFRPTTLRAPFTTLHMVTRGVNDCEGTTATRSRSHP